MALVTGPGPKKPPTPKVEKKVNTVRDILTPVSENQDPVDRANLREIVDTKFQPFNSLLSYVEGSQWTVNYFSQVVAQESEANAQALDQDPVNQQYRMIIGYELKVTTPLAQTEDEETRNMEVTGTSNTLPGLVPNVGDMFVADVGDGRAGIFKITSTTRQTMMRDAVFEINYLMVDYLTADREHDLNAKVVRTEHFNRDFLLAGDNPFLTTDIHQIQEDLRDDYYRLIYMFLQEFYDREDKTVLVPNDTKRLYDFYFTKTFTSVVSRHDLKDQPEPTIKAMGGDVETDTPTLWRMLLTRDKHLMTIIATRFREVAVNEFSLQPYHSSIAMSGLEYALWPRSELTHNEKLCRMERSQLLSELRNIEDDPDILYPGPESALIYTPDHDGYYVFSKAFYTNDTEKMSALELQVHHYLNEKAIDLRVLAELVDDIDQWEPLERFYFILVILILIKVSIRGL